MSVLIRGMKMPNNCDVCIFSGWSNLHQTALCKICEYDPCFDDFSKEYLAKRANFCPLVEIQEPHGRLIDADALNYKLGSSDRDIYVKYTLEEEPTVIEAEDER